MAEFKGKTLIRIIDNVTKAIDEFEIDALITRNHNHTAKVTEHKAEEGYKITDHVITEPIILSLDGMISDIEKDADNPHRIFQKLENAISNKNLMTIITSRAIYNNMAAEGFSETASSGNGSTLKFKLSLKEIRTAKTKISKLDKPKLEVKKTNLTKEQNKKEQKKTQARYQNKKNVGKVSTKTTSKSLSDKLTKIATSSPFSGFGTLPNNFGFGR